jgi:hypothetical protein
MRANLITLTMCNVNTQRPITAVGLLTSRAAIYTSAPVILSSFINSILNEVAADHGPMRDCVLCFRVIQPNVTETHKNVVSLETIQ